MKKFIALILAMTMAVTFVFVGCGSSDQPSEPSAPDLPTVGEEGEGDSDGAPETEPEEPAETVPVLDVFTKIWDGIPEDQKPMAFGGDYNEENQVENAPGKHEIGDGTELDTGFGFPVDMTDSVAEAAAVRHMLNVNQLSAAMYRMNAGADIAAFAQGIRDSLMNRAYMCGWPEVLVVMSIGDSYVLSAYGNTDLVYALRDAANGFTFDDGSAPTIEVLYDESMEDAGGENTARIPIPEG